MRHKIFILLLALIIPLLQSDPAQAHRSYVTREGTITSTKNEPLIVEKLNGDGIFFTDPASLQIRNMRGHVLAYSPTTGKLGSFCPSIHFCVAIEYFPFGLGATVYQLNIQKLESINTPQERFTIGDKEEDKEFSQYLNGETDIARSFSLAHDDRKAYNFEPWPWHYYLLLPIVAYLGHYIAFTIALIIGFVVYKASNIQKQPTSDAPKKKTALIILLNLALSAFFIILFIVYFFGTLATLLYTTVPALPFLTMQACGYYLAHRVRKKAD